MDLKKILAIAAAVAKLAEIGQATAERIAMIVATFSLSNDELNAAIPEIRKAAQAGAAIADAELSRTK